MTPEGLYKGTVVGQALSRASTGNFTFTLDVKVTKKAADLQDWANGEEPLEPALKRTLFLTITGNTKDRILADLKFIGYDRKNLASTALIPGNPDSFDFTGRDVPLRVEPSEYNGKTRERWNIDRNQRGKKLTPEDTSQFDTMFGDDSGDTDGPQPPF